MHETQTYYVGGRKEKAAFAPQAMPISQFVIRQFEIWHKPMTVEDVSGGLGDFLVGLVFKVAKDVVTVPIGRLVVHTP